MKTILTAGALILAASGAALATPLVDLIDETRDGSVRFSYAAREGVWGDGKNRTITDSRDGAGDWCRKCEPGPVRVELKLEHGRVADLEGWVGGKWIRRRQPRTCSRSFTTPARRRVRRRWAWLPWPRG